MTASITMKDVAREAGVSLATVSNVLNNNGNVDPGIAGRVRQAARDLGYRRNYVARLLKTNKTKNVMIILPTMADENFRNIFAGAERVLADHGYSVSLHITGDLRTKENLFLEAALEQCAAGVILATCQPDEEARVRELAAADAKLVFIEREPGFGDYPYLDYDNRKIIHDAARDLLARGRKRLVLLSGPKEYSSERQAVLGFTEAMEDFRRSGGGSEGAAVEANMDVENAFLAMVGHLDGGARPDAVITTSMLTYRGAKKAMQLLDLPNIDAVRFVAVGCRAWDEDVPPGTEILSHNSQQMGEAAAETLLAKLSGAADDAGGYRCIRMTEPALRSRVSVARRFGKSRDRLRLFLSDNSAKSIRPLLVNFENRHGVGADIDTFDYEDMFPVLGDPEKLEKYDILQVDQPLLAEMMADGVLLRLNGLVDDLPELPPISGAAAPTADLYSRLNGDLYAVPFRFGAQLMFYRSDLFHDPEIRDRYRRAARSELKPPRTWREFNAVGRFFTRAFNPDSPVEYGISLGSRSFIGAVTEYVSRLWAHGGTVLDGRGGVALDSRPAAEALRNYLESFRYSSPESRAHWTHGQMEEFTAGRSAMMVIFSALADDMLLRHESPVAGRVGFTLIPGDSPLLGGWSLGVRRGSGNAAAAVEWIRWITSDRMAIPHTIMGGANMAAMLRRNSELRSLYPWLSMALESFRMSRPHEVSNVSTRGMIRFVDFAKILSDNLHAAIRGALSPEEALAAASRRIRGE